MQAFWLPASVRFHCNVNVCPSLTRKPIVSLYFGWDVRTRLGVAIFEVYGPLSCTSMGGVRHHDNPRTGLSLWATCLAHKDGGVPLSTLPKDTTRESSGLFSTTSLK